MRELFYNISKAEDEILDEFSSKVDDIFAIINGIRILSNIPNFKRWYSDTYRKKPNEEIFFGYRLFVETLVRGFMNSIIYDAALPIDEDFIFSRARFLLVPN